MVPSKQEEVFRVLDLVGKQEANRFKRLLPPVNIVPKKEVVALWRKATVLEESKKVVVLAVDVPCQEQIKCTVSVTLPWSKRHYHDQYSTTMTYYWL